MKDRKAQRGFSLVELMMATAVFAIISVQLGFGFTGLSRLMRHSYAETELAIAEHKMHDRILFNLKPIEEDAVPSGALSLTNVTVTGSGILFAGALMKKNGASVENVVKSYQVVLGSDRRFSIQNDVNSHRWLTPADMFSLETDISQIASVQNGKILNVDVSMKLRNEAVSRTQRISIPIFKVVQ